MGNLLSSDVPSDKQTERVNHLPGTSRYGHETNGDLGVENRVSSSVNPKQLFYLLTS